MKIVKPKGESAQKGRTSKMHGSSAEWGLHVAQGNLQRQNEKPSVIQWARNNYNRHPR